MSDATDSLDRRLTLSLPLWAWAAIIVFLCAATWIGVVVMERQKQERHESALGVWSDGSTGLMWTKKDNGAVVDWNEAVTYCKNLSLGGYGAWRLPWQTELHSVWHIRHFKGGIALSVSDPFLWTATVDGPDYGPGTTHAVVFFPYDEGAWGNMPLGRRDDGRVLCVHNNR